VHQRDNSPRNARDLDHYVAWRTAAAGVERAFAAWRAAPHDERPKAFAAYARALDDEGTVARACARGLRDAHIHGLVHLRSGNW
jgi:hypothetical protein